MAFLSRGTRHRIALEKFKIEGKVAIVTGGSRGIGRAIALGLAQAGADVVVASRRLPDLETVAQEIKAQGRKALAIACNTGRQADREELVRRVVAEWGGINILVNNAATNPLYGSVLAATEEAWDKVMEVNLKGYFFLALAVAKVMKEGGGGAIVNIASEAGLRPYPNLGVYGIGKAGVVMMTRVLAQEWGRYNIRVNAIAPSWVHTRMSRVVTEDPAQQKDIIEHTALGRLAQPDDIVGAVLLLASEASRHITGETLVINGGYFM